MRIDLRMGKMRRRMTDSLINDLFIFGVVAHCMYC